MPKKELQFRIEGATPYTLPMARLAEYLKELAKLLGSEDRVHFLRVDEGSANCLMEVEEEYEPVISERVRQAQAGHSTKEANKAFKVLLDYLHDDENSAVMQWSRGDVVIEFPRKQTAGKVEYGPFTEEGSIDGLIVNLGGVDNTVPVHLVYQGRKFTCNATPDMARRLRNHLLEKPIRVHGKGKWYRNAEGDWEMLKFDILDFEELSDASLWDVVGQLRSIPDNDLTKSEDPLGDMNKLRHG
jgi:hypothetical protein